MSGGADTLRLLLLLAVRNLRAHRVKSVLIGGILFFGTFLVVVGSSLLGTIQGSMERSITSSLAGHVQVYDAAAKDELQLFGQFGSTTADIGEIPDLAVARRQLLELPGVAAVVPMGITNATMFNGTELDRVLERLRDGVRRGDPSGRELLILQIQTIARNLRADLDAAAAIASDRAQVEASQAALDRVLGDALWADFAADPVPVLEFLDTTIAPIASDGRMIYVRVLGTDLDAYEAHFDRFRIVDGQMAPRGERGILFAKRFYERWVKHKVARELDQVREAMANGPTTLAESTFLRERLARNARGYERVLFQLTPADADQLLPLLRAELGVQDGTLDQLLPTFLAFDDESFERRYAWFYEHVAPRIRLYEAPVGEEVTLRAYTRSGYVRAVNVKVWGTFTFDGLETSDLAAAANLTDLVTFRSLYGRMSDEQQAELQGIRAQAGVREVSREDAEAALFGGGEIETTAAAPEAFDEFAGSALGGEAGRMDSTFDPAAVESGLALNLAVILQDGVDVGETVRALSERFAREQIPLRAVDWQSASGIVGQLILVLQVVLLVSLSVIFAVAMVIVSNALVMATVDRITEIGTMRAIGAYRGWVVWLFVVETLLLGLVAGGLGAAAGGVFIGYLGIVGIPAPADAFILLFAGPRLYPLCGADNLGLGLLSVLLTSGLSALYPALVASRVQPVVAMAQKE